MKKNKQEKKPFLFLRLKCWYYALSVISNICNLIGREEYNICRILLSVLIL